MFVREKIRLAYLRHVVIPMARIAGPRITSAIALRLARGIFDMNPPGRSRAERRIAAAIEQGILPSDTDAFTISNFARTSYEHYARFWAETILVAQKLGPATWRRHVRIRNEHILHTLASSPRGCIIATAYHGNLAVAACALGHVFKPVHVIADFRAQRLLKMWRRELNRQLGVCIVDRSEAAERVPMILDGGGAVMLVAEHHRPRGRGVRVNFLGGEMDAYPTIGLLASRQDVPVLTVTCTRRREPFKFELEAVDVIDPRALNRERSVPDADEITRRALSSLERAIAKSPEQYLWSNPAPAGPEREVIRGRSEAAFSRASMAAGAATVVARPTLLERPANRRRAPEHVEQSRVRDGRERRAIGRLVRLRELCLRPGRHAEDEQTGEGERSPPEGRSHAWQRDEIRIRGSSRFR